MFPTTVFAMLSASGLALSLEDAQLDADGNINAVFASVDAVPAKASGSLLEVQVLTGPPAEIEGELNMLTRSNPYIRPLRLLVSPVPHPPAGGSEAGSPPAPDQEGAAPEEGESENPAPEEPASPPWIPGLVMIVGTFQP